MDGQVIERHRDEAGDTLVEICITLVIIGLVVGAFLATYATASTASKAHRDLVTADAVLRDYAEATKNAVRSCTGGGSYTMTYPRPLPAKFIAISPPSGTVRSCPAVLSVQQVDLTVTMPNTKVKKLSIDVRTP